MGKRLTQIATRTGDDGTTGLANGERVPKWHLRVQAMGDVDELNSHIGMLLSFALPQDIREILVHVQHELFNLGGELSMPGTALLAKQALLAVDQALQQYNARLPALQEFILPAGTRPAAQAHVCRAVARRSERTVVLLQKESTLRALPAQYLNRLSDMFFVLARVLNRARLDGLGVNDVYWRSDRLHQHEVSSHVKG